MSVNTGENKATAGTAQQPQGGQANQGAQGASQPSSWGFFSMAPQGGIGRSGSSQILARASEKVAEILKEVPPLGGHSIMFVKLDKLKEKSLALSSIMIAVISETAKVVAYHTLLLEENSEGFPARTFQEGRNTVNLPRYTSDAYNDKYVAFLNSAASRLKPGHTTLDTAATIVPVDFRWDDKNAGSNLVVNAIMACVANLESSVYKQGDLDFSKYDGTARLQMQIAFGQDSSENYAGMPVRSDIKMRMLAISNERRENDELNNPDQEQEIAYIHGYIDQAYVQKQSNDWGSVQEGPKPCFAQRFIMTGLECTAKLNLTSQLLSIYGAMSINSDYGWRPNYNQRWNGQGNTDVNDIGAFNIEANLFRDPSGFGPKIDTRAGSFDDTARTTFLRQVLHPTIALAIDVAPASAETWYTDVFMYAANGDVNAIRAINQAADKLTGNAMRTFWPNETESPVIINKELVHMGYYEGSDGTRRDIRHAAAYLPVANMLGVNDNQVLIDWNESFYGEDRTEAKRLNTRLDYTRNVVASKVVVQQMARRITFDTKWMEAFQKACAQARISMQVVNPELSGDFRATRSVAGWFEQGSMKPLGGSGNFYHQSGTNGGGGYGHRGPSGTGRQWGSGASI